MNGFQRLALALGLGVLWDNLEIHKLRVKNHSVSQWVGLLVMKQGSVPVSTLKYISSSSLFTV